MIESATLLSWAEWLLPAGGLGAVIVWLTSKAVRSAQAAKECHDAYKSMYDDLSGTTRQLSETVNQLKNENIQLESTVSILASVLQLVAVCRHNSDCPVSAKLQRLLKNNAIDLDALRIRQYGNRKKRTSDNGGDRLPRDGTENEYR